MINNYNANSWMGNLTDQAKMQPVNRLIFPGTHDSAAYSLDFANTFYDASPLIKIVNFIADRIPFIGKIIKDWTITQEKNIREQLDLGIRQLDFRVSYYRRTDRFFLMHTFNCIPLEQALEDVLDFLNANKEEILIINMKSDWPHRMTMNHEAEEKLFTLMNDRVGEKLAPINATCAFDETMSLASMVKADTRIIFSYGKHKVEQIDTPIKGKFNWDRNCFNTPWPNSSNVSTMLKTLGSELKNNLKRDNNKIHGLSFTLTPQAGDIVLDIFKRIFCFWCYRSQSINSITTEIFDQINGFIEKRALKIKANVSVISVDFATEAFVKQVIEMNEMQ